MRSYVRSTKHGNFVARPASPCSTAAKTGARPVARACASAASRSCSVRRVGSARARCWHSTVKLAIAPKRSTPRNVVGAGWLTRPTARAPLRPGSAGRPRNPHSSSRPSWYGSPIRSRSRRSSIWPLPNPRFPCSTSPPKSTSTSRRRPSPPSTSWHRHPRVPSTTCTSSLKHSTARHAPRRHQRWRPKRSPSRPRSRRRPHLAAVSSLRAGIAVTGGASTSAADSPDRVIP